MGYYSAIIVVTMKIINRHRTWMNLEGIMMNEKCQSQMVTYKSTLYSFLDMKKIIEITLW